MENTTGIYVHIPFCIRKCHYCDFLSFPASEAGRERYVDGLVREIRTYGRQGGGTDARISRFPDGGEGARDFCPKDGGKPQASTVFIGGGTPSILPVSALERIFAALSERYGIPEDAEITIECNPGTADLEKLRAYRRMGINRISFGVQSASDTELETLGRIHTFADASDAFMMARRAGFANINVDLMSAVPGQTLESYRATLEAVLALNPEHISAYSLIVEEGTPFYETYGDAPPVDEDTDRAMYALTKEMLRERGYGRYEVSNYAKEGYACRHNLTYWTGGDYTGFGLGAASKVGNIRYRNETDLAEYVERTTAGENICYVEEVLETEDEMSEFFILGLRKTDGVSRKEFAERFSAEVPDVYEDLIRKFSREGLLVCSGDRIAFTDRGLDISNYVLCNFM